MSEAWLGPIMLAGTRPGLESNMHGLFLNFIHWDIIQTTFSSRSTEHREESPKGDSSLITLLHPKRFR